MPQRIWIETKMQPSTARSGHHISCILFSLHFLCDILTSHPVVGKSYSVHTSEEVEMSNITILALAHDKSNHFKGTMWAMDHGLKCQCHYQLPRHTQVPCMWRTFARKESEKNTSEIIANARLFWQNQSQE